MKINSKQLGGAENNLLQPGNVPTKPQQVHSKDTESSDSVRLSLHPGIANELDPAKLATDRRQKIEQLKAQIAAGTYNPPLEAVAQSVQEELDLEVDSLRDRVADE